MARTAAKKTKKKKTARGKSAEPKKANKQSLTEETEPAEQQNATSGSDNGQQTATATALLLATLWAPMVENFPTIFEFFQKCWFFIAAPIATVFIYGALWKRATPKAAFWTLILCFPLFILPYVLQVMEKSYGWQINEFNLAGVIFIFTMIFMAVTSMVTAPPKPEQIEGLVWNPSITRLPKEELEAGYPFYKNIKLWSLTLIVILAILYYKFW